MKLSFAEFTRRQLLKRSAMAGAAGVAASSGLPLSAFAEGSMEDKIVASAKEAGPADLSGIIWSNYMAPMRPSTDRFAGLTGIDIKSIQDISIFAAPPRVMAEAVSRSPEFDFFHIDSNMIPSLASAGLLEPLDPYMEKLGFEIEAVGTFANFMKYKGQTYGIPTDGNVHTQFIRWDLVEARRAEMEDAFGREITWPETWEEDLEWMEFFHNPDEEIWGSANLRNRANGATWWYMNFYSAGGFPFDDDVNPTINNDAGNYATEIYLKYQEVSHPETPGWGTPQMIPRMTQGNAFACQYWDGIIALNENPEKSKTAGGWKYGTVPGSDFSGKRLHRSISSPLGAILVNKYSPNKEKAAHLALWWGTLANSEEIVADRANTFHDPWHVDHMTSAKVQEAYTPGGMEAIEKNLQIASPPIYLTGYLEFQDALAKNLSEAYVGQIAASDVLPRTEDAWNAIIRRTGRKRLQEELASYKEVMPKVDKPA